jgi:hypothetical protein
MERETKEIKTKGGHIVAVKSFLTGRERKEYDRVLYSKITVKPEGMKIGEDEVPEEMVGNISEIPGDVLMALEDKMVELLVVSVDGIAENPKDKLENLPADDYGEVIRELRLFFRTPHKS